MLLLVCPNALELMLSSPRILSLPFLQQLDPVEIAGTGLWAIAFYLGFYPQTQHLTQKLQQWLSFPKRSLSDTEAENAVATENSPQAFWASILSILPFVLLGWLCYTAIDLGLGGSSWGLSTGLIAVIGTGIFELGRRHG
jgi:hypothetical protein